MNRRSKMFVRRLTVYSLVVLALMVTILPFLWLFISSISPEYELYSTPPHWVPEDPTLKNYVSLFAGVSGISGGEGGLFLGVTLPEFVAGLLNSTIVGLSTTAICVGAGALAAYSFARFRFKAKNTLLIALLVLTMMPGISIVIPLFLTFRELSLLDTPFCLIIAYTSFALPFGILILKGFFESIPIEVEESAQLDGCNSLQILTKIVMPLARPGLTAAAIFAFLLSWDEFFFALIFTFSNVRCPWCWRGILEGIGLSGGS